MKAIDFLQLKCDTYGVRYYNTFSVEYTPNPNDNITGISFHKSDVSGKSEYHIFTDNTTSDLSKLTVDDIRNICCKTSHCKDCKIFDLCNGYFSSCPNNWNL